MVIEGAHALLGFKMERHTAGRQQAAAVPIGCGGAEYGAAGGDGPSQTAWQRNESTAHTVAFVEDIGMVEAPREMHPWRSAGVICTLGRGNAAQAQLARVAQ